MPPSKKDSELTPKPPKPPGKTRKPSPKLLARLEGRIFFADKEIPMKFSMRVATLIVGRSDPAFVDTDPFRAAKIGVHLGLGISSKLSRQHAKIEYDTETQLFTLTCMGKNGLTIKLPDTDEDTKLTHTSQSIELPTGSLITIADCVFSFSVPTTAQPKKRKRREWIKSEHLALRTHMMRFGYGRWSDIIAATNGRLSERQPAELAPVARTFVARCYIHARPGVEQKALLQILHKPPTEGAQPPTEPEIEALLNQAREDADPDEKRKYVRWARKLRLLSRLQDIHDHPSLERLRAGELRVMTPPPARYWTSADDADLIIGSYKHGYGAIELIRTDPGLGYVGRYAKPISTKKGVTPVKQEKSVEPGHPSEEEDEDEDDPDEDEDERNSLTPNAAALKEHLDDENAGDAPVYNPKKKSRLGERVAVKKEEDTRMEDTAETPIEDSDMSPVDAKLEPTLEKENADKASVGDMSDGEKTKKKRLVPKRGPRIGNEDGYNNPEDASAAAREMADENGLVPFPNSEALMRRLKSTINSCAKEFDRDQREIKKKELAASRAKQRKDDLAARKAEKEAEKTRQRAERRIARSQPFSKKEALEFERALSNFGVVYKPDGKTVDWKWFHTKVDGFGSKYDETLDAAYLELLSEAHRINDLSAAKEDEDYEAVDHINEAKKASAVFSTLTVERAEKLIERLEFFRALRGEVLPHPKLAAILRGFKKGKDLPLWWKSSHDRSLLWGVDRHGLSGWEGMAADGDLTFFSSMKAWQRKNGSDTKAAKRAAMPKSSAGIKRAQALVRYFRSRANDPHFELYSKEGGAPAGPSDRSVGPSTSSKAELKDELMEDKPLVELLRNKVNMSKMKKKTGTSPVSHPSTGRPRTLRQTIIKIPKDENGILILPSHLGDGLFLLHLGEVMQGVPAFCQNGIIFPAGYRTIRQMGPYAFLCEVLASQDRTYPEFRVSLLDGFNAHARDEDNMWKGQREIGTSPNLINLWMKIVNEVVRRDPQATNKVALASGTERFGFYEPTIVYYIQKLPGAKYVEGFQMRDFSWKSRGAFIEPSVGLLDAMMKALDSKLEAHPEHQTYNAGMSDEEDNPRQGALLAMSEEMSIPRRWIEEFGGSKKKQGRRRSNWT